VLWKFKDIPMIEHVYRRASFALSPEHIFITSGDSEILDHMRSAGSNIIASTKEHSNGMNRVSEAVEALHYDTVIVLQADEILIDPLHLKLLINSIDENVNQCGHNLVTKIKNQNQLKDYNVVKCLLSGNHQVSDMFRENRAYLWSDDSVFKVMGTYSLTRQSILQLAKVPDSKKQSKLSIEQIKILENSCPLKGVIVDSGYPSINTIEEIAQVEEFIRSSSRQKQILSTYARI
jgi:CMP-2-keto-3-deoxyoctulosonic acid synthetase